MQIKTVDSVIFCDSTLKNSLIGGWVSLRGGNHHNRPQPVFTFIKSRQ